MEPTDAKVRRYRMGCIRLRKPVAHLWYFRNTPNILSVLINISAGQTDELLHFDTYTPASPGIMNYFLHGGTEWYIDEWEAVHATFGTVPQKPLVEFTDDGFEYCTEESDIEAVWNTDAWVTRWPQQNAIWFPTGIHVRQKIAAQKQCICVIKSIRFAFYGTYAQYTFATNSAQVSYKHACKTGRR